MRVDLKVRLEPGPTDTIDRSRYPAASRLTIALAVLLLVASAAPASARLGSRVYASGFSSPVAFVQDPLDRSVQFVVEQNGTIRVVRSGSRLPTAFLDLTRAVAAGGERGLLGPAFAPDAASGRFFVNFTNPAGDTVIADTGDWRIR